MVSPNAHALFKFLHTANIYLFIFLLSIKQGKPRNNVGEVIKGQDNRIFEDSLRKHIMREREESYFSYMS